MASTTAAAWYGRDSSRKTTARLWFDGDDVCAENEDGDRCQAPLARVEVSPRLANVPRRIVFPDGVSLSVSNNDFIDSALTARRHHRAAAHAIIYRMERYWRWLLLLLVASGGAVYGIVTVGVPAIAHAVADRVSVAQLQTLTETTYQQLLKANVLAPSRVTEAQRQQAEVLFNNVVATQPSGEYRYRLSLHVFAYGDTTDDNDAQRQLGLANAFALPDGLIIATDALLAILSEDEIAAIFAHEIGHVRHRHGLRSFLQAAGVGAFLTFAFGDVSTVLLVSSFLLNLKYSRDFEQEADCDAFAYLQAHNLPPTLVRDSLRKLEQTNISRIRNDDDDDGDDAGNNENSESDETTETAQTKTEKTLRKFLTLLSTHPDTEERINQACPSR